MTLEKYIHKCLISEDNPGILFTWEPELDLFVQNANELNSPVQSPWISTLPGQMTPLSFQQDVINDLLQHSNVQAHLRDIEVDAFCSSCHGWNSCKSCFGIHCNLHDKRNIAGIPSERIAPPSVNRKIFSWIQK
jgi:hypothetical protein